MRWENQIEGESPSIGGSITANGADIYSGNLTAKGNIGIGLDFGRNSEGEINAGFGGQFGASGNASVENLIGGGSIGASGSSRGRGFLEQDGGGTTVGINFGGQVGIQGEIGVNGGPGVRGSGGISWGGSLGVTFGGGGITITGGISLSPYGDAQISGNRGRGGSGYGGLPPGNTWTDMADPFSHVHCDMTIFIAAAWESLTCRDALVSSWDIERKPIPLQSYFGSRLLSDFPGNENKQCWGSVFNDGRDFYGRLFYPNEAGMYHIPKREIVVGTNWLVRKSMGGSIRTSQGWVYYPPGTYIGPNGITPIQLALKPGGVAYTSRYLNCGNSGEIIETGLLSYPQIVGYVIECKSPFPIHEPRNWWHFPPGGDRPYIHEDDDMSDCSCTCTNDSNARLLAEIEKIRKWLGAGDKIEVPEHLLTDKAQIHRDELDLAKKVQLENFAEILEWYLGNLSGWLGAWGRNVKTKKQVPKQIIEKINGVDVVRIEYEDKDVDIDLPDVATCFELLAAMLLDMQDDNARALQASYSATVEAHQARQQSTMANYGIQAVIDAIGGFVHIEEKRKKLPALLSFPSESELKKLAEKPYEQQVERLLTPSEIEITVSDFKDNTVTLSEALIKLLEAASVIKGCFTIPIAKGETPMEVAAKLKQLVSDGYLSRSQISAMFEDNLANAEKGYNVFPDPWGESWEQRPKIRNTRMIDRDNTLANGDGIGGSI